MDKNEELKFIMDEVQKFAELKKAVILNKILQDSPFINEVDKVKMLHQMDTIRTNLGLSQEMFQTFLKDIESGKVKTETTPTKTSAPEEHPKDQAASLLDKIEEDSDLHMALRKRYCLNSRCKFSFLMGKNFKKSVKKCLKCGGNTIFILTNDLNIDL